MIKDQVLENKYLGGVSKVKGLWDTNQTAVGTTGFADQDKVLEQMHTMQPKQAKDKWMFKGEAPSRIRNHYGHLAESVQTSQGAPVHKGRRALYNIAYESVDIPRDKPT